MAELYFKVRADWEEATRLRKELDMLEEEILNTSDATEEGKNKLKQLTDEYKKNYDALKSLVEVAAKNAEALKQMGAPLPDMILKQGALSKASLSLGKSLIKLGLSAAEAKAAMSAIATGGISLALTGITLVVRKLIKTWQEKKQAIEEAKQAQEEFFEEIGKKAAPTIASFQEIRDKWVSLKSEMAKTDFLKENKKALDKLGVSLNSVAEADQLFIDNAENYVRAQIRYAEADIYRAQVQERIAKAAAMLAKVEEARASGKTETTWEEFDLGSTSGFGSKGKRKVETLVADRLQAEYDEYVKTIAEGQKKVADTLKKGDDLLLENQQNGPFLVTTLQQDIDSAKERWEKTKETLEEIQNNRDKHTKQQLLAAQKAESEAKKEYEALAGKETTKTTKVTIDKEEKEREKAYEKYKTDIQRVIKSMEMSIANEQISALETESERVRARIELEKQKNLDKLREMGQAMSDMFKGNVDLANRPEIDATHLYVKGWDDAGEGTATVFSSSYGVNDANGKLHEILVTPILPDGKVLSPEELENYVGDVLDGADDILSADNLGIVIAVDVDEDAGERLHQMQEDYYYLKQLIDENDKLVRKNLYNTNYKEEVKEEEDDLDELLAQYGSYEDKKAQIHLKWLGKINAADEEHAAIYRKLYQQELMQLEMSSGGALEKLFGNIADYTRAELEEAKQIALELLHSPELDTENAKIIGEQLTKIDAVQRDRKIQWADMNKYLSDLSYLHKLEKDLAEAEKEGADATDEQKESLRTLIGRYKELTKDEKPIAWFLALSEALGQVASAARSVADSTGNKDADRLAGTLEGITFMTDTIVRVAQKDYLGAAMSIVSQIVSATAQEAIMTEQLARNSLDFANAMKLASLYIKQGDFSSVFGTDRASAMREYGKNMVSALQAYEKAVTGLENYYWGDSYVQFMQGAVSESDLRKVSEAYQEMYGGLNGLQAMQIRTKDRAGILNFIGINDEFTSLHDLAPQIFNEDGTLNIDNTKTFLGSDLSKYLDDAQRQALENAVNLEQAYEDNLQGLKDSISAIFGGLSDNLTDLIVDGIRNGTDISTEYLKDNMLSVVDQLERQMINGMIFKYLSQYEDQMLNVAMNGTEQDMFDLYDQIFNGLDVVVAGAQQAASQFEEHAKQRGWDLTKLSDTYTQQATAGGFQTMSQDVASELNGRFTALQISNEGILQGVNFMEETMTGVIQNQLSHISISEDIRKIQADSYLALIQIRDNTEAIVSPIRDMRDDIEQIKKNTSNL